MGLHETTRYPWLERLPTPGHGHETMPLPHLIEPLRLTQLVSILRHRCNSRPNNLQLLY